MMMTCIYQRAGRQGQHRRGGILLEVMLAMALFVAAAAFVLAATRNVVSSLERAMRDQQAVDLARSKLAELDAGLISIMDLRDGLLRSVGSIETIGDEDSAASAAPVWIVDVATQRTEYRGLTLVELTVREDPAASDAAAFTVRQLVRLREPNAEAYEEDELFDDLPPAAPEGPSP